MPDLKPIEIKIGTSGFSFEDWRKEFYPENIEKGKMLDHYINFFDTVEINSTYYRIPHPMVMYNLVKKVPKHFEFIVKVPQSYTHKRTNLEKDVNDFNEAIKPVIENNMLSGLLAQFPYSFKYSEDALDYVCMCKDIVAPSKLFVEFRHDSWVNRTMYDRFCKENINYVAVDGPQLNGLLKPDFFTTGSTGYLRLHGRNSEKWWNGGALRYDYNYSHDEINEWVDKLSNSKSKMNKLFLFFNNCHGAQAVKNALDLKHILKEKGTFS